ncbi:MAG: glycosyltransferase family 39 protein [Candidatus Pacebacteria bacterium]|nr:glycosyltransferase family 39 protein [Candidatus Paceibacterota bacterium]
MPKSVLAIFYQDYWRDEAISLLIASKNLKEFFPFAAKDIHPPLYYLLLHFWIKLFSESEFATRSLSLICHLLLVFFSYQILKHLLKNRLISLWITPSILLNPFLIKYAAEARAYSLFGFLVIAAIFFYLKKRFFLSSFFWALTIITHNISLLYLTSLAIFWFWQNKKRFRKKIRQFTLIFGLPILVFLLRIKFIWSQSARIGQRFWIKPAPFPIFLTAFKAFFQGQLYSPKTRMLNYRLALALILISFFYWIIKRIYPQKTRKSPDQQSLILVFLSFAPLVLIESISLIWIPLYHEKVVIPSLPLFIIWIACALLKLGKISRSLKLSLVFLALIYNFTLAFGAKETLAATSKPPIRQAVNQILLKAKETDIIIPESPLNFPETKYYLNKSAKKLPVLAFFKEPEESFHVYYIWIEPEERIYKYPQDQNVWIITLDGKYFLRGNQ